MTANTVYPAAKLEKGPSGRLAALDGFRGLAILIVLVYHFVVRWTLPADPQNHLPQGAKYVAALPLPPGMGWAGVSLFFMISGFVIAMTLERSRSIADFGARRMARIWPPLLVAAGLTTAAMYAFGPPDWRPSVVEVFFSSLIVPPSLVGEAFGEPNAWWVDGVYWTLFIELKFYILSAILWRLGRKTFMPALVAYAAVGVGSWLLMPDHYPRLLEQLFFPEEFVFFAIGVCGYRAYFNEKRTYPLSMAALGLLLSLALPRSLLTLPALGLLIFTLFSVFILGRGKYLSLFARGVFPAVGRISYSLYLIHQKIGVALIIALCANGVPFLAAALIALVGVLILATGLQAYVEVPGKRLLVSLLRRPVAGLDQAHPFLSYARPSQAQDR